MYKDFYLGGLNYKMKSISNFFVKIINRWLPDPFLFAIILTIVVYIAAIAVTGVGPIKMLSYWGSSTGFWGLLAFAMQMALVVVLGSALASAPICKSILRKIASLANSNKSGIIVVTMASVICSWVNWGFGLIAGAMLAKEVARRVPTLDYRLVIASAYGGFVIWHAGLSGSIPLTISGGYTIGEVTYQAGTNMTIFHPVNIIMVLVILFVLPLVMCTMHPDKEHTICVDPALLKDEEEKTYEIKTPADRLEHSRILWIITLVMGFGYLIYYFYGVVAGGGNVFQALNLNIVNMLFMFLGLLAHGDLRRYVDAIGEASTTAAGILLQFPFYAGIMGMMVGTNENGVSLASAISNGMVAISNDITFPMLTFLSAGIVNFFVPSGGGQWAVQGPIVMPAAAQMGIEPGRACMAIAWGDQWTNMIQPFWALPALGVAGLSAKDIMGYLVVVLIFVGIVAIVGFWAWAMFF